MAEREWSWICEFCYATTSESVLPPEWDFVWQSAVCPECRARVARDGGYSVVKGGAYAGYRIDPRDSEAAYAIAEAVRVLEEPAP